MDIVERLVLMWNKSLPLYKEVANKMKDDILSSNLSSGEMIPSEAKLATYHQVSRVTVRKAIKLLEEEGLLYSKQGSGTYIKNEKLEYDFFKVQSFTAEMKEMNTDFSNEILDFQLTTPSPQVQKILNLSDDDKIFFVIRLRHINGEPYILEESHLPAKLFPELSIDIMKQSLYAHVKNKGHQINNRQSELEPIMPDEKITKLLQLDKDVPILLMKNQSTFQENIMFEYTKLYFHPYKYTFRFKYSIEQ